MATASHEVDSVDPASSRQVYYLGDYLERKQLRIGDIADALQPLPGDIVYAAGSVVEGLGDSTSDIDIFVLTSDEGFEAQRDVFDSERRGQQQLHDYGIRYLTVSNMQFDVEYHRASKVGGLVAALRVLEPKDRACIWQHFRTLGEFDRPRALEILHRFRTGLPLCNFEAFGALKREYDDRKFIAWNAHYHLIECEDFFVGIERSLRSDDADNAYLKLTRLYDSLVDAELFLSGHSIDRWKWRLPKLRAIGSASLKSYRDVQLCLRGADDLQTFIFSKVKEARVLHADMLERLAQS